MAEGVLQPISVTAPAGQAMGTVGRLLFGPFDLERWLKVGFCAWLATLGQGFSLPNFRPMCGRGQSCEAAKDFVLQNLSWLIPLGVFILMVGIAIWLAIFWLNCRGRFIFLHCIAKNVGQVKQPWSEYKRQANSLFVFRIVLGIITVLAVVIVVAAIVAFVVIAASTIESALRVSAIIALVIFGAIFFIVAVLLGIANQFTVELAAPVMLVQKTGCVDAWRRLLGLSNSRPWAFVKYILFRIVIGLGIFAVVVGAIVFTCCCAACVFMIPYIGTVVLLPVVVFKTAYSMHFLRQFGPAFDAFAG